MSASSPASTLVTLPTLTPAIRTGEPGRIEFADSNVALTWKGVVNGMSFVKPEEGPDQDDHERDQPDRDGAARRAALDGSAGHQGVAFSVVA